MKKLLYILLLTCSVASAQVQPNYTGSGVITNKNTAFVGDSQTPDGMGIIHVTRSSAGGNKAYIGMTRNGAAAYAIGVGSTNNFIIGTGPLRNSSATIDSVTFEHNSNTGLTRINKANGTNIWQVDASGYMKAVLPAYASGTFLPAIYNSTNARFETSTDIPLKSSANTFTALNTFSSGANNTITAPDTRIELSNPTASTAVTLRQVSPSLKWSATGWNTTSLASQPVVWEAYAYGNSGNPITGTLQFKATVNGSATYPVAFREDGTVYAKTYNTTDFSNALVKSNGSGTFVAAVAGTDYSVPTQIVEISGTSQSASVNTIYIPHNASLTTITLPVTSVIGSLVQIVGEGAGGWKIAQNSGQFIKGVGITTTTGTGGSLASTDANCTVTLRLTSTNKWTITSSQGTLTPL